MKRKKVKGKSPKASVRPRGEETVGAATARERAAKVLRLRPAERDSAQDDGGVGERGTAARRSAATKKAGELILRQAQDDGDFSREGKPSATEAAKVRWREVRAGIIIDPTDRSLERSLAVNPLLQMSDEKRSHLFAWLRECPYDDAVLQMLAEDGMPGITRLQLSEFFAEEAESHWEKRISRAAEEANALVRLAEKNRVKFSGGILTALGQEVFRQVASGRVDPSAMGKLATLFLKARSDERTEQMQGLKREKLKRELQGQIDHALDKLAEEVDRHPEARGAFEALRKELARTLEEKEEP